MTTSWLILTSQIDYRLAYENFNSSFYRSATPADAVFPDEPVLMAPTIRNRAVPITESTYYAFSPALQVGPGHLIESKGGLLTEQKIDEILARDSEKGDGKDSDFWITRPTASCRELHRLDVGPCPM